MPRYRRRALKKKYFFSGDVGLHPYFTVPGCIWHQQMNAWLFERIFPINYANSEAGIIKYFIRKARYARQYMSTVLLVTSKLLEREQACCTFERKLVLNLRILNGKACSRLLQKLFSTRFSSYKLHTTEQH